MKRRPEPRKPSTGRTAPRRLVGLAVVLAGLLLVLVASAPYRSRVKRETAAMRQQRLEVARLQAEVSDQAAGRRQRAAQAATELASHPADPAVRLRAGLEPLDLGEARAALRALEPAARARPRDAEVRAALGQAYEATRRLDRALEEYRAARRLSPGVANDLRLATFLSRLGWRREALALLKDTAAHAPRHAGVRIALAMLQFQTGDLRAAEEELRRAGALDTDDPTVPALLTEVHATAGRIPEARQAIESALRHRPDDPDFLALRGELALMGGDQEGAEQDARAALAVHPGHSRALETLARVLRARSRPAEALATLELLLESGDAGEGVLLTAAQLARQLRRPAQADALLRRRAHRQTQRREIERWSFRAAFAPTDPEARLRLGRAYLAAGDPARAVVELRRVLELRPGWLPARRALAAARTANGG